jgi:uncharacterized protein (DUF1800 family)
MSPSGAVAPTDANVRHALNRLSFGPRPGEVQQVRALGVDGYLQQQLAPEQLSPAPLPTKAHTRATEPLSTPQSPILRISKQQRLQPAIQQRLRQAVESPRQLEEVMVDFWFNHFNVDAFKGEGITWISSYESEAIRPHVFGRFRDLLGATARHPAMLYYLDNWQNTAPNSPGARGRFKGLNENYARELMELHTLGVEGGYTQQDVVTLARVFTGWGLCRGSQEAPRERTFCFNRDRHDFSPKVFLGQQLQRKGRQEGEQALDILARSPATARHISYQLAQYFVADQPPKVLVDRLAQRFQSTDGNIRAVLTTLFQSPEFWQPKYHNAKFKTPYQYVVSTLRATDTPVTERNARAITNTLQQLGMPLYRCASPDGYKNTQDAWLNPNGLTYRLNFVTALTRGQLPGFSPQRPMSRDTLIQTLGVGLSPKTQQAIAASPSALHPTLILGSPEFMRR